MNKIRISSICSDITCDIEKTRYILEDLDEHTFAKQADVYSYQKAMEEMNICTAIVLDYLSKILEQVNEIDKEINREEDEKSEQDEKHQDAI